MLAMLAVDACASSPLPTRDDLGWQRGEARLASGLAAAMPAARLAPDEILFTQAEGFFHYRYQPEPPGFGRYMAEAGAAALEFGPLSVLATSEAWSDLRLHAYDGAAQLYETLLARWPQSRLRPLALYRLGWCYRNVTAGGFPRTSDDAFAEVEHDASGDALAPLAREARKVPWKSQDRALLLSIIPGAGQMYAGRVGNGLARLTVALALATAAVLPIVLMARDRELSWKQTAISIGGFVGLQVIYTDSYQTALHDVVDWNERQELEFERAHPTAP